MTALRKTQPIAEASRAVIELHQITKRFQSDYHRSALRSLRMGLTKALGRRPETQPVLREGEQFVFQNLDLTLQEGECLALVGRNGVGKTTLLKIISGLTEPDSGRVKVNGRCIPVLGLRTGMAPALSGQENAEIYFAIVGLSGAEKTRALKQAREFSGLADSWDKPTRYYSSGMLSRLALSSALYSSPRILLLDEVFAVGDTEFRLRGTARLKELAQEGVSMVVATHENKEALEICTRALWLRDAEVPVIGPSDEVVREYRSRAAASQRRAPIYELVSPHEVEVDRFEVCVSGKPQLEIEPCTSLELSARIQVNNPIVGASARFRFKPEDNRERALCIRTTPEQLASNLPEGVYHLRCELPTIGLKPGRHACQVEVLTGETVIQKSEPRLLTITGALSGDTIHNSYFQRRSWTVTKSEK